jgi:molybdopterin-guanine dinucleotide biosynthesis protein A
MMPLTGIVLAGGKSSRMGTDKGLLNYKGKRLVEYSIDLLRGYCNDLIISTNNPEYSHFGIPTVADEFSEKGPAVGIFSALKKSSTDWNLVLACDMPFLNRSLVDALLSNLEHPCGVVPLHDGLFEPLAAVYHKRMEIIMADAIRENHLSMHQIIKSAGVRFLQVENLLKEFPLLFENLNYSFDIEASTNTLG